MLPTLVSLAFIKHLISYNNSTTLTIQYPHFTEEGIKAKRVHPHTLIMQITLREPQFSKRSVCFQSAVLEGLAMPGGSLEQKDRDHKCINIVYQKICSHTVKSGSTQ